MFTGIHLKEFWKPLFSVFMYNAFVMHVNMNTRGVAQVVSSGSTGGRSL